MPRSTSFGRDTGLQIRMTVTLFLLGLLYVVLVVALLGAGVGGGTVAVIAGGLALLANYMPKAERTVADWRTAR